MQIYMMTDAETDGEVENGFSLLLRLYWDRAVSATLIFVSLSIGSWLVSL
jgi:hypothetical protein